MWKFLQQGLLCLETSRHFRPVVWKIELKILFPNLVQLPQGLECGSTFFSFVYSFQNWLFFNLLYFRKNRHIFFIELNWIEKNQSLQHWLSTRARDYNEEKRNGKCFHRRVFCPIYIILFSSISCPHHNKPKMNVSFYEQIPYLLKYLTIM